jgi:hypothetical protein
MKKTSLLLAIGALLYGTSVYADDLPNINPEMTDDEIGQVIDEMGDIPASTEPEIAEDEADPPLPPGTDPPDGLDPAQALPLNVGLDNSNIVHKPKMCSLSETGYHPSAVNGDEMAKFPVTVNGGPRVWWKKFFHKGVAYFVALGKGWILVQKGDTWYKANPWRLYSNIPISSILLEPLLRKTMNDPVGQKRVYAFDIGGKRPTGVSPVTPWEHTKDAARGQFIIRADSSPKVDFTAIYSDPVIVDAAHTLLSDPPFSDIGIGTPKAPEERIPNHDLYGTLEINFKTPIQGGLTLKELAFAFVADTDCIQLPVIAASLSSNLLTLFGEGLVYVMETKADGSSSLMSPPFEVMADGVNTFNVSDVITGLNADSCYSLVNENALGTNIPLEIDGVDMPDGQVCL